MLASSFTAVTAARSIVAAFLFCLIAMPLLSQEGGKDGSGKPKETAEQKAVRQYLKENLPTGKWEEIKWWGPQTLIVDGGQKGPLAVRLKFRAANELGGMSVYDDVFVFRKNNTVQRYGEDTPYNFNKERIFGK